MPVSRWKPPRLTGTSDVSADARAGRIAVRAHARASCVPHPSTAFGRRYRLAVNRRGTVRNRFAPMRVVVPASRSMRRGFCVTPQISVLHARRVDGPGFIGDTVLRRTCMTREIALIMLRWQPASTRGTLRLLPYFVFKFSGGTFNSPIAGPRTARDVGGWGANPARARRRCTYYAYHSADVNNSFPL